MEKLGEQVLDEKLASGELGLQDLELLIAEGEIVEEFRRRRLTKAERKALSKRRTIERLLALSWIGNLQLYLILAVLGITFEPLSQLNELVYRRFGADLNWILAAAILTTHENLVKKKLAELGVQDDKIETNLKATRGI